MESKRGQYTMHTPSCSYWTENVCNCGEQPQGGARCERTGNLCGSDTWMEGRSCPCKQCQAWLADESSANAHSVETEHSFANVQPQGEATGTVAFLQRHYEPTQVATAAQTEGGEKPPRKVRRTIAEMKANGITAEDLEGVSTPANTALQLEPSSPPATAPHDVFKEVKCAFGCGYIFPTSATPQEISAHALTHFSPPATAVTAREFGATWEGSPTKTPFLFAEAYADQRVRRSEQFVAQLESNIKFLNERVEKLRQEQELEQKHFDVDDEPHEVADGFGSVWPPCEKHDRTMQIMRPGDARCPDCENEAYIERIKREAAEEREARERAEKALREAKIALEKIGFSEQGLPATSTARWALIAVDKALKSSQGGK